MKKYLWITAALAIAVFLAGITGFPLLYDAVFDASSIVEEQRVLPEMIKLQPEYFVESLKFPLSSEARQLSVMEREDYLARSRDYFGVGAVEAQEIPYGAMEDGGQADAEIFRRLFALAGMAYDESCWNTLSASEEAPDYYLLKKDALSIAMEQYFPVLLYYENQEKPAAQEMEAAVKLLRRYADTQDSCLQDYISKIDGIYEGYAQEPLLGRCRYGKWQVYYDDTVAVLVCIMEQDSLVLFYDAADQQFCGFRR